MYGCPSCALSHRFRPGESWFPGRGQPACSRLATHGVSKNPFCWECFLLRVHEWADLNCVFVVFPRSSFSDSIAEHFNSGNQDEVARVWTKMVDEHSGRTMRVDQHGVRRQVVTWPVPLEYDGNEAVPKYVFLSEWVGSWWFYPGVTSPTNASRESSVRQWLRRKLPRLTERLGQDLDSDKREIWACTTFENLRDHFLTRNASCLDNAHCRDVVYRRLPPLLWKFGEWHGASMWWANHQKANPRLLVVCGRSRSICFEPFAKQMDLVRS